MSITSFTYITIGSGNNRRIVFTAVPHIGPSFEHAINSTDPAFDPETMKDDLKALLEEKLKAREVAKWLEETEQLVDAQHAVKPRYLSTWRAEYKNAIREEHLRLGYKMHREQLAATFTNAQMNTAWEMDDAERIAFLGRVETAHDKWVTLQAEVGE